MDKIMLQLQLREHKGAERIFIKYGFNTDINKIIKTLPGARYSQTCKSWHISPQKQIVKLLAEKVKEIAAVDIQLLHHQLTERKKVIAPVQAHTQKPNITELCNENNQALALFIQTLVLKAYSESTIRTYKNEFYQLLKEIKQKPVQALTTDDIRRYMYYCLTKYKISEATANSRINAIKFYYEQVLGNKKIFVELPRPKKALQLPRFFNQDEIALIIKAAGNIKHKVMLMLAYSAGLRVSEVVKLKAASIDSKRMSIFIEKAKGKKDRVAPLSPVLLVMLREYWKVYKPVKEGYLFQGQVQGEAYSIRSLQLVLTAAKHKAGIIKPGNVHALRHSFATHLLDKGTDVTMIMKLLGHNDLKTTLRYLHVTNRDILHIVSPLDDLELD